MLGLFDGARKEDFAHGHVFPLLLPLFPWATVDVCCAGCRVAGFSFVCPLGLLLASKFLLWTWLTSLRKVTISTVSTALLLNDVRYAEGVLQDPNVFKNGQEHLRLGFGTHVKSGTGCFDAQI